MQLPDDQQHDIQSFVDNMMEHAEPTGLNRLITGSIALLCLVISFASGYATGQQPDISDQFVIDEHRVLESMQAEQTPYQPVYYPELPEIEITFEPV